MGNVATTPDSLTANITLAAGSSAADYSLITVYACTRYQVVPSCAKAECTPAADPPQDCSTITVGTLTPGTPYYVSARATPTSGPSIDSLNDVSVTLPYP